MLRNWKIVGLSTLITAALAAPATAGDTDAILPAQEQAKKAEQPAEDPVKSISEQLKNLTDRLQLEFKKISEVTASQDKRLSGLEANDADTRLKLSDVQIKLGSLEKEMRAMRADLEALRKQSPRVALFPPNDKTLEEIHNRLAQIEQKLDGLPRITKAPPAAGTGRVVLVNYRPTQALFVAAGRAHRVEPGTRLTIENLPAGPLSYELILAGHGTVRRNTPVLGPGETLTLTIR